MVEVCGGGFEEFTKRADAMKTLAEVYFREDFSRIEALVDSAEMGAYSLKCIGIELIMCGDSLLGQMSSGEKTDFLKRLHAQLLIKQRFRDVFGGISDAVSAYIFDKVTHSIGDGELESQYEAERMKEFRERLIMRDPGQIELMLNKFKEYVKNQ